MLEQIKKNEGSWPSGPKVFGIGLSKTGTTSLNVALEQLGYDSQHFKSGRTGRVLGWPEFFRVDAATDVPCSAHFEVLYHTFEDSQFIYTVRDIDNWKQSIIKHTGLERPTKWNPSVYMQSDLKPEKFESFIRRNQYWKSLYCSHDSWEEAYRAFENRVLTFFENKPRDRFHKMNITGGDGWESLCSFLGHDTPNRAFPHANSSSD
ncbi:sulfotransferase family protein [Salinibacter ruber]|uniref:sulfotransferase family protein n=1 Tax=Salinibacter ruber TaxID=146919 RepID=UPI003C6E5FDF